MASKKRAARSVALQQQPTIQNMVTLFTFLSLVFLAAAVWRYW